MFTMFVFTHLLCCSFTCDCYICLILGGGFWVGISIAKAEEAEEQLTSERRLHRIVTR